MIEVQTVRDYVARLLQFFDHGHYNVNIIVDDALGSSGRTECNVRYFFANIRIGVAVLTRDPDFVAALLFHECLHIVTASLDNTVQGRIINDHFEDKQHRHVSELFTDSLEQTIETMSIILSPLFPLEGPWYGESISPIESDPKLTSMPSTPSTSSMELTDTTPESL